MLFTLTLTRFATPCCVLIVADFEIMSWMTGWALCGHGSSRGGGGGEGGGGDDSSDDDGGGDCGDDGGCGEASKCQHMQDAPSCAADANASLAQPAATEAATTAAAAAARGPAHHLSREQRVAVGLKCKALIDWGRAEWLRSGCYSRNGPVLQPPPQRLQVSLVEYIPAEVSGENKLLLAWPVSLSAASATN